MTDNLRALALAATEGPWVHATNGFAPIGAVETQCGDSIAQAHQVNATCDRWQRNKNAAFIAAANPVAVLSLLDEIDRLKAEISDHERAYELLFKECGELRKDAEWRPIETAPKDGTHIVVVYAKREAFGVGRIWAEVVKWDDHYCGWSDDETEYIMSDLTFTHWKPLSAPPDSATKGESHE